ncbi:MAG: amino acid-binding protein [Hyphomicrobiales bacterium]|nr:amino acid-binding protein [Hyphomicrobiales bacterium]
MAVEMVLTVIAKDRPGLVETVADIVAAHSGNWIDSAMARLGGQFAGILRISVDETELAPLEQALTGLREKDISVTWREGEVGAEAATARRAKINVIGQDHAGIVRDVTRMLSEKGVNVDRFNSTVFVASMSGAPMFVAEAEILVPDESDLDDLREALEDIAHDIMVDIELHELADE